MISSDFANGVEYNISYLISYQSAKLWRISMFSEQQKTFINCEILYTLQRASLIPTVATYIYFYFIRNFNPVYSTGTQSVLKFPQIPWTPR